MKLHLSQTSYHFEDFALSNENAGRTMQHTAVTLRIIQPSPAHGAWRGNPVQIREWTICRPGVPSYAPCKPEEIEAFEAMHAELGFPPRGAQWLDKVGSSQVRYMTAGGSIASSVGA
jgi:hypothetical protein